jgi:oligopeptide transport system permease protein
MSAALRGGGVAGLIGRRLLQLPVILLVIYTTTLVLSWAVPGNPLDRGEGRRPSAEVERAMLERYNLDSFPNFYVSYLDSALGARWVRDQLSGRARDAAARAEARGEAVITRPVFDFGPSLQYEDWRVNEIIASSLPVSMGLGLGAIAIAMFIGLFAGVVGAVKPNSLADISTLALALIGISMPSFVIGTALVLVFPVWLGIGAIGGWGTIGQMVLPMLTLSLPFAAYIARLTRMGMVEHMKADFIRTARAKGLPESRVLLKHALKNAFLPVLSFLGPAAAAAMTGSFVVEKVFTVPGMGQHFVNAVLNKDLFLIIGVVLIYATLLIVFNLAVDVLYRWVDPRID